MLLVGRAGVERAQLRGCSDCAGAPNLALSENRWKGALTALRVEGEEGRGGGFLIPTLNIVRKLQTNIVRYKT